MYLVTVAIGQQYLLEAERLKKSLPNNLYVFHKANSQYTIKHYNPLIDGLYHKTNFANYFNDLDPSKPIIFLDADCFSMSKNPFANFKIKNNVDIAFVPYPNKHYYPTQEYQNLYDHFGYKINSGFMYFKNISLAQEICTKWSADFLSRPEKEIISEYDEYSLMRAIRGSFPKLKIQLLDQKWNVWQLSNKQEILNSDSIFFQSHKFLDIIDEK